MKRLGEKHVTNSRIGVFLLSGTVARLVKEYFAKKKEEKC